jgi:hypothetical protein
LLRHLGLQQPASCVTEHKPPFQSRLDHEPSL